MDRSYVELHLHTAFSFLDGASQPWELVDRAQQLGYEALAVTDHDGLYGAMEFAQHARNAGIAPIIGAELTLTDDSHLTLLAATATGYTNLSRLITEAHRIDEAEGGRRKTANDDETAFRLPSSALRGIGKTKHRYRDKDELTPRLNPALLASHAEGLILLTGCRQGRLAQLIDTGRSREAACLVDDYVAWMGAENVVVELQQNLVHGDTQRIKRLVELANARGLRYAATGNVHYHVKERHRLQDVLVAIKHHTTLDGSHRERRPNAQFHLRSAEEMARLFRSYPEALRTTVAIAERCRDFDLTRDLRYAFPDYPTDAGETPDDRLARVCYEALTERYKDDRAEAETRLKGELAIIARHKLAGFFLLYRDLLIMAREVADEIRGVDSARSKGNLPPGRGRGSSVSSIVCYLIGLSHVDPLKHNLFVGRFLNEELPSIPDIDLDFPREIRERLIERVYERYGDRAALVCAFSTYKLRSAVRDVGKTLGIPLPDLDQIAKLSGSHSATELGTELARIPAYAGRTNAPPWSHLIELSSQLAGLPRHVTQHVGGMIVSATPIAESVPVQPSAMEGRYICQWDKDSCDDARFVKIDFLALGMLSLVEECLELIAVNGKPTVDLSRIDLADPAIYDMICAGDTIGVFQIESRAQIQMLPRTYPRTLEDLIVQVAIVRPGPIIGGAVKPYVAHRQKSRQGFLEDLNPVYDHPFLEPVLRETHGVVLYQEQVIQVAMELAGFTAGQADALRRAMTRKRSLQAMSQLQGQFIEGALKKEVTRQTAETVFQKLTGFAAYGFPKAHAAAFALLAYQSSWLKHYYPAEFTCALLNNQPMGFYPPHVLTNDAKRHGLRILSPDINGSGIRCSVEGGNGLRIGLGYVAELGELPARRIVIEREINGPYRSLADVVRRAPTRIEAMENLIAVGAFDRFGLGRREALWQLGLFVQSRRFGQTPATDPGRQLPLSLPVHQDTVELRPMGAWDQMAADYAILGISPRYHPLGLLRTHLPARFVTTTDLEHLPNGLTIQIAGLVVCRQRPGTAKGITFLLLEDELGLANVIVHPALYETRRLVVRGEPFVLAVGRLQKEAGVINIIAHDLRPLDDARAHFASIPVAEAEDPIPTTDDQPAVRIETLAPTSHNYR